jgi:succinate dehydrogenase hydrophobic anchor subunit
MLPLSFVSSFIVRFTAGILLFFFLKYLFWPTVDILFFENTILLPSNSEKERLFEYFTLGQWVVYICLVHAAIGIYHVFEEYLDFKRSQKIPFFRIISAFSFIFTCFLLSCYF